MVSRVHSFILSGIDASPCEIEVDSYEGALEPRSHIVGLPDTAVRESIDRVRAAMLNSGYLYPQGSVVVNLAPADVRKEGPVYDLPIAVAMLAVGRVIPMRQASGGGKGKAPPEDGLDPRTLSFAGELALDGRVRPVKGIIAMASLAKARGLRGVVVPRDNAPEAAVVDGIEVHGVGTLAEVVGLLNGMMEPAPHPTIDARSMIEATPALIDFGDVKGQEAAKRAMTIAAAGTHNIIGLWSSDRNRRRRRSRSVGHNRLGL